MMRRGTSIVVVGWLLALPCLALEVPRLERRVTDLAGLFSSTSIAAMERDLEALDRDTGAQLAVLTVPSLEGQPLEDFSMRVVEAWRLGQTEADNGVLVLIARDDRRIRIEVGYGVEGVLPDALCIRIIDSAMKPAFRRGDFEGGTQRAVELIAGLVRQDPEAAAAVERSSPPAPDVVPALAGGAIFVSVIGVFALSALFAKGAGAWLLYLLLAPFLLAFPGAFLGPRWGIAAALAWLVGFPIVRALVWQTAAGRRFRTSHPTWTTWSPSGSTWGGRGGSGGGSFGGFSGGGGSFGGGGASGGW